ncbi:MAG TPA: pepsin/retropepsin-like aspartic protease family protein [Pyrinomonadaceae bacterium]|nr:pepsin/retropepsin-like aspartic protease family protein [Pyrinomonadaceae bacterium]
MAIVAWAVPIMGTAHQFFQRKAASSVIPLRDDREHGLLAKGWVNGAGPFVFVIDTGAGASLISRRVADEARLQVTKSRTTLVGGLSTAPISTNQEAALAGLSLGQPDNRMSGRVVAAVVDSLPRAIDGVLDPTEAFSPSGYSVDIPNRELRGFSERLNPNNQPPEGAVVRWLREPGSHRPFVRLGDGSLALVDTGSGFGLALNESQVVSKSSHRSDKTRINQDLGGGRVQSRQITPQRVNIGVLVLNGVPTDVLSGVAPGTPIILGRRALFPFKITFDPASRLIAFEPTERD